MLNIVVRRYAFDDKKNMIFSGLNLTFRTYIFCFCLYTLTYNVSLHLIAGLVLIPKCTFKFTKLD